MRHIRRFAAALFVLAATASAFAQGTAPAVSVSPIPTVTVVRGGKAPFKIDLAVNRGFHVNSNKPHDELLLPTTVRLSPPTGVVIMNIQYPEGEELALPFMGKETLNVYSGPFTVRAEVRVPKTAPLGLLRVHGEVKFQACDNRQCYPPRSTPLEFDLKIVKAVVKKKHVATPQSPHIHN